MLGDSEPAFAYQVVSTIAFPDAEETRRDKFLSSWTRPFRQYCNLPARTEEPVVAQGRGGSMEAAAQGSAETSPLGKAILAGDIAATLLFLAGEHGRNISGQTIVVDGSRTSGSIPKGAPNFHLA